MTYLHRNSPHNQAIFVLTKVQMDVLIASISSKLRKDVELTIDWAIRAIARLEGYLEHRKKVPLGYKFCGEDSRSWKPSHKLGWCTLH